MYKPIKPHLTNKPKSSFEKRRIKLINLINIYLHRPHISRKDFLKSIQHQLKQKKKLSLKQFDILYGFLQKEQKSTPKEVIYQYYQPIIWDYFKSNYSKPKPPIKEVQTLDQFFM